MKYRKGDTVTLHGVIRHDSDSAEGSIAVDVNGHYQTLWLTAEHMELDEPRLEIGDWVSWGAQSSGTIRAISAGYAWVEQHANSYCTCEISELTRVKIASDES